jgi:hypothetical protein
MVHKITKKSQHETEVENAKKDLMELMKEGNYTVYTRVSHVAPSGMSRVISSFVIINNEPRNIDWFVGKILDYKWDEKHDGVRVGGAGMDMGFHLVYSLSSSLFPKGFDCIGEGCPSSDHVNYPREKEFKHHSDGGYRLKQKWL